jgi:hypothetical protein
VHRVSILCIDKHILFLVLIIVFFFDHVPAQV